MRSFIKLIAGFCCTIGLPFIVLAVIAYWPHIAPFVIGGCAWLLMRNKGR